MAASVTATSVLPVPPKPEPTVITPDFSDGSRMAAIRCRLHRAISSRLARSRLPDVTTSLRLGPRPDTVPLTPSRAGAGSPREDGDGVTQAALPLPGNSVHHAPGSSGYWVIASSPSPDTGLGPINYTPVNSRVAVWCGVSCSYFRRFRGDLETLGVLFWLPGLPAGSADLPGREAGSRPGQPRSSAGAHGRGVRDQQRVRRHEVHPVRVVQVPRSPPGDPGVPVLPHDALGCGVHHAHAVIEVIVQQDVAVGQRQGQRGLV